MAHHHPKKIAVLLVNLGSPDAPTPTKVRCYLREFLSDPRVVNLPRLLWWIVLNLIVLPFRPRKAAKAYRQIWTDKGSPLSYLTHRLTRQLAGHPQTKNRIVDYAMRYGKPSIANRLQSFHENQVEELIIVPLYPQYSSTTTASVYDAVNQVIGRWRHIPSLRFISDYHQHPAYIQAIADSISKYRLANKGNELLLMSFHGLPAKLTGLGDPYFHQCQKTAMLVAESLGLTDNQWKLVFQSRFGKTEWLQPYCLDVLRNLPQQGCSGVDIVCPGFAVDCLETLEEIAITNKNMFFQAGGQSYHYIPALNDSDEQINLLLELLAESKQ